MILTLKRPILSVGSALWVALGLNGALSLSAWADEVFQARGYYAKGSLREPSSLLQEGPGYVKLFQSRGRQFGSRELVGLIEGVSAYLQQVHPDGERIQIGDIAAETGGRISGHASHQNGLDADLSFFRMNRTEQPISDESGFTEVFVKHGKLTENFDIERNWLFFHTAVSTWKIQRIFVDPAIKRLYCILFDSQGDQAQLTRGSDQASLGEAGETLRRLRPYQNHDDHMHIRLYCPAGNTQCISQEEVLPGTGCRELQALEGRHESSWDSSNQKLRKEHDGW